MTVASIRLADPGYPAALREHLGARAPETLFTLGDVGLLRAKKLALFCSVKCPGDLILKTYDLARELRDLPDRQAGAGATVVSGFHSPMEKECLELLLRGKQPVIWCMARRLTARRLPRVYGRPLDEGRLLMLSPFGDAVKRPTAETARVRNEFVAALADSIFVAYAAPGGRTETLCRSVLDWRKPLFTLDCPDNSALLDMGAQPYRGPLQMAR